MRFNVFFKINKSLTVGVKDLTGPLSCGEPPATVLKQEGRSESVSTGDRCQAQSFEAPTLKGGPQGTLTYVVSDLNPKWLCTK